MATVPGEPNRGTLNLTSQAAAATHPIHRMGWVTFMIQYMPHGDHVTRDPTHLVGRPMYLPGVGLWARLVME